MTFYYPILGIVLDFLKNKMNSKSGGKRIFNESRTFVISDLFIFLLFPFQQSRNCIYFTSSIGQIKNQ